MTGDLPDVQRLAAALAELHKQGLSLNDKYTTGTTLHDDAL